MCLIFFAVHSRPDFPFVLVANRDEFYARPTEAMHWWAAQPVLAGKDLEGGGTWLAVSRSGKVAAVTNYRDLAHVRPDAPSRGRIPLDVVLAEGSGAEIIAARKDNWKECNGFNLLFYDGAKAFWYSNMKQEIVELDAGVYGLSNALLDTPWPKVKAGKEAFTEWVGRPVLSANDDTPWMADTQTYAEALLPNTGVGAEMEKLLSAACIISPIYGTRSTTTVLLDSAGNIAVKEKNVRLGVEQRFDWQL